MKIKQNKKKYPSRHTIKRMGRKVIKWKKIFSNYIPDNFCPKYMKELPKVRNNNKYPNIKMSQILEQASYQRRYTNN